ncbi:MAG: NADH-quinone oxidoreductase subunit A [candidate division WOR-3 bacterium]
MIDYLYILLIIIAGILLVLVAFILSQILHKKKPTEEKYVAYECGIDPESPARDRYSIKYYLVALLFLIFDIEVALLLPWAIIYNELKIFGFIEMLVFLGILIFGYFWVWKKGIIGYGTE